MEITIYRGTKEVGGTMIELKSDKSRILLDAGFPLFYQGSVIDNEFIDKPYQELLELGVIPKVEGLYSWDEPAFDAILISHAHSDHFGLLKHIHPGIPIYLSEVTDRLIETYLSFPIPGYSGRDRRLIPMYETFCIGDFVVKAFLMDHTAYHSAAFEISCEGKTILYTGDFRGHGKRCEYLTRFLKEAGQEPDLLLIEGTTLGRGGVTDPPEEALEEELKKEIKESNGIVLCQPASQNVDRIVSFYHAAKSCGKIFVMDRYTADLFNEIKQITHENLPLPSPLRPDIRVFGSLLQSFALTRIPGKKYPGRFRIGAITAGMIKRNQNQIVMLVRSSSLADLKRMKLKGGKLIYSQWKVYREKPSQVKLENYLKSQGFSVVDLNTSGHAFEADMEKVVKGLSPKKIVPIHTFRPDLFPGFGSKVELPQDGVPFKI